MSDSPILPEDETVPRDEVVRLAAQFIEDAQKRADVLALLAFAEVLRDVPARVSEPLLGDIRYTWWGEALEEIRDRRKVRYHPLSAALAGVAERHALDMKALIDAIDPHRLQLDGRLSLRDALSVADQGQAVILVQAAKVLDATADAACLRIPARFQTLATLKVVGRLNAEEAGAEEGRHLYREARQGLKRVPSILLPLVLPAAVAADLWHGRVRGALSVRLKLLWTFATGRI
ncbi:squalene/phytoene synthase family protein [Asticcacaulis excentricus]|uniref:Squalene/phytoene synthase n=1 Tax=Asticcacaulis excentricus (strain ATCC 15261 / DSM 4724 / KCTC 12464 / NCIMB 9791 / VKM B-1370 / CB 48) TaxID=573065 RepID=E8RNM0_ASTEC|nr:squalene/phytoene synthase family protein [Asticcacaulis excentricus]ADU12916.1 Squalene/phytoene synthase [Asticcacaulis excentricus CB 48]